jgi:3-oxoadipate enol-lactonase
MNGSYSEGGARLGFSDSGSGLPVVFLHPTPLDRNYWRPLCERILSAQPESVRVLVPDLRGHGVSELGDRLPAGDFARVPDAPVLTMAQLARDILALLDYLGLASAVFAGCSIGGYVMLELWRRAPDRMRGLAFVCSKPQPDVEANLVKRAATIAQARSGGVGALFDGMAQNLVGASARARRPAIVAEVRAQMTLNVNALVAVQAGLAVRPDSVPTVSTIRVPVLAVAGGADPSVSPEEMQAFLAAPGGCTFHLLPEAGHFAAYEQPDDVVAFLTAWIRALPRA